jgi:hypothetical protein
VLPPALILRSNCNDLFSLGDEFQQVIPCEILPDSIADEISYLAFARLAIILRGEMPLTIPVPPSYYTGANTLTGQYWMGHVKYLTAPEIIKVSKAGYVTKTITLTGEPRALYANTGQLMGYIYLLQSPEWNVKLEQVGQFLGTNHCNTSGPTLSSDSGWKEIINARCESSPLVFRAPAISFIVRVLRLFLG